MSNLITEHLLFAVHRGTVSGRPAGVIGQNSALPIACSHNSWGENPAGIPHAVAGFHALWEAVGTVEEFFEYLSISSIEAHKDNNPQGLYVCTVTYDQDNVSTDDDNWDHLSGGELRRPDLEELVSLSRGGSPWNGVVL